jgi:hypothetical protein
LQHRHILCALSREASSKLHLDAARWKRLPVASQRVRACSLRSLITYIVAGLTKLLSLASYSVAGLTLQHRHILCALSREASSKLHLDAARWKRLQVASQRVRACSLRSLITYIVAGLTNHAPSKKAALLLLGRYRSFAVAKNAPPPPTLTAPHLVGASLSLSWRNRTQQQRPILISASQRATTAAPMMLSPPEFAAAVRW